VRGWALARHERTDEALTELYTGSAIYQMTGMETGLTTMFCMLADAYLTARKTEEGLQAVAQGLAVVEKNKERVFAAELWRLQGELLFQAKADSAEVESGYQQAIAIAQQQSAKSWELRATASLARLWQQQGKPADARQMLADIYDWFTEGFDTADLQDAKALLDELHSSR
jgi:predicted ATPase